ncbi:MAG: NUDIX domain-containing protein [Solobacterium sp.]|nr:NUDIX domain-containing protein [Solobacterium sp.]
MKYEKSCGAFVFRIHENKDEVLLIRQVQGHWCFPKGHVEKDESEEETALREIKEETGLKVKIVPGFRESLSYSPKEHVMKDVIYFTAKPKGGKIRVQQEELSEIHYVSFDEAIQRVTYENDRRMFEKARDFFLANRKEWL